MLLSQVFKVHRRYYRSINLERDLGKPDAVDGYILTEQSLTTLNRLLPTFIRQDSHRAWTLTGVYGTGKSAFVHFLASLCFSGNDTVKNQAIQILQNRLAKNDCLLDVIYNLPSSGLVTAVATAKKEPVKLTLIRALTKGIETFFSSRNHNCNDLYKELCDWEFELDDGRNTVQVQDILKTIKALAKDAKSPILLIIDELGKNLEYAAQNPENDDLYLLQQIAELSLKGKHQIYFIGLLHQSFAGYSDRLSVAEQNEWTKIQGRFEDIVFSESPTQMLRLIGQVIDRSVIDLKDSQNLKKIAKSWYNIFLPYGIMENTSIDLLYQIYPLHPITAFVLPLLCQRYAQNDRSLFTFLTSDEPHGFNEFLTSNHLDRNQYPTLCIDQLYDYFIETVAGLSSRPNFQRWLEVKNLIDDAKYQPLDVVRLLKAIGVLNLISTTGGFRASPELVAWALCDRPDPTLQKNWLDKIDDLKKKTLVTHRKAQDELRLWQGSDFDIEAAIFNEIDQNHTAISHLLTEIYPLKPIVAHRHYIQTGNLRYFEQCYGNTSINWGTLTCSDPSFDGLVLYWLDIKSVDEFPKYTVDGKPLIVIHVKNLELLKTRSRELQALNKILAHTKELQTDKVALREVRHRLVEAERLLDETIVSTLRYSNPTNTCWITGEAVKVSTERSFQNYLSNLCDRIYFSSLVLDNELINRRELTSQGTKARRQLITAMIEKGEDARLGLEGYGPEVTMYASILESSGIHQILEDGLWTFVPPNPNSGLLSIWTVIEEFCTTSIDQPKSLDQLYQCLEKPPYGVKQGVIPILLAAVLLHHMDDVGVYQDGTYIPMLGVEHFELLIRYPQRFSVKCFAIAGLRSKVFKELESILKSPSLKHPKAIRNSTLLTVVTPLYQFVKSLPRYTQATQNITPEAQQLLQVLQKTVEPDELLFVGLPQALGLDPISPQANELDQTSQAQELRTKLVIVLREIHGAYDALLTNSKHLIYKAFGIHTEENKLREDLRVRSSYLLSQCIEPILRRFMLAAVDTSRGDRQWLESLLMIVADKPPESWTDKDVTMFEVKLADLVRRFRNLEALQKEVAAKGEGFDALRITVTESDGSEAHQMIWAEQKHQEQASHFLNQAMPNLETLDPQSRNALLIHIVKHLLKADGPAKTNVKKNTLTQRSSKQSKR